LQRWSNKFKKRLVVVYLIVDCSQPLHLTIVFWQIIGDVLTKVMRFTLAMVSLMGVKEAFTQEMRRVLLDMMECYVDHVVKVTQIYIFQSILIIQSFIALLLDMLWKGITHRAESVVRVQEKNLWEWFWRSASLLL
jgi:hypothetical protein